MKCCEKSPSVSLESSCLNKKMHMVIDRSQLPESELRAVTFQTVPAPAHEIEID